MREEIKLLTGDSKEELLTLRNCLERNRSVTLQELRTIIGKAGRWKWELLQVSCEFGCETGTLPAEQLDFFRYCLLSRTPVDLILRLFRKIPTCHIRGSGFTALHLIVNSPYPDIDKLRLVCRSIRQSACPLFAADARGRTAASYCRDRKLKQKMLRLTEKIAILWAKGKTQTLQRVPGVLIRVVLLEYM